MRWKNSVLRCFLLALIVFSFLLVTIISFSGHHSQTNHINSMISYSSSSNNTVAVSEDTCRRLIRQDNVSLVHQMCQPLLNKGWRSTGDPVLVVDDVKAHPGDYVSCVTSLSDCVRFRTLLGYIDHVTPEELDFPIAFGLLTYENFEQTERLLRLIYRPSNLYCLHVDAKSPVDFRTAADAIASCLPNVIVARPATNVHWGKVSIVHAELQCIKILLAHDARWKYYVNVVGRDFPLRTNRELVEILRAYNGSNDIDGSRKHQYYPDWFKYSWKSHDVRDVRKTDPPHGFVIAKGYTHMAATRDFVDFALNDQKSKDLLNWMRDIKVPDEHFFQTLNHNPQLSIPGSFRGDPDTKRSLARIKHWSFQHGDKCAGTFVRWICNIGVGDLPWVTSSRHMFVNKIRLELDPLAYRCLEAWYNHRVFKSTVTDVAPAPPVDDFTSYQFNVSFYANQPFVTNHV